MTSTRDYIFSRLLLTTFVVGSVVAPASHYAFMLFSEAYGMHHVMMSGRKSVDSELNGESHFFRMAAHPESDDFSYVGETGMDGHGGCLYWSLIASLLLAEPAAPISIQPVGTPCSLTIAECEATPVQTVFSSSARGPPVV